MFISDHFSEYYVYGTIMIMSSSNVTVMLLHCAC